MTALRVGIASYGKIKARTLAIARGELKPAPDDPKVWFTSLESFAKILSGGNRELLKIIAEKAPSSLDERAKLWPPEAEKTVAYAQDDGKLRPSAPRTRGARPDRSQTHT